MTQHSYFNPSLYQQPPSPFEQDALLWIKRYCIGIVVSILLIAIVFSEARLAIIAIQVWSRLLGICALFSSISVTLSPLRLKRVSLSSLFLVLLGYTLQQPFMARSFVGAYHVIWPDTKFLAFCDALRTSSTKPSQLSPYEAKSMFQFRGLGDGYLEQLSSAMEVHFDRYARNETEQFPTIKWLNLLANQFGDRGVSSLSRALSHDKAYTESISIGRNCGFGDAAMHSLNTMLVHNKALLYLTIDGHPSQIGREGYYSLFSAFSQRSMGYVNLCDNKQIRYHLPLIGEALLLEELLLTGTGISDSDVPSLVQAVLKTNITKLSLFHTRIGPRGVKALLPLTKQLTELDLGMCTSIGDTGAKLLASALNEPDSTLTFLSLFESSVGQDGAQAFLDIFPQNTRITYLSLGLNSNAPKRVSKATLDALEKAIDANQEKGH